MGFIVPIVKVQTPKSYLDSATKRHNIFVPRFPPSREIACVSPQRASPLVVMNSFASP